jgi:cyclomaltodextrin glucanotransferase
MASGHSLVKAVLCTSAVLAGCSSSTPQQESYYGTLEAFASESVYLVLTDRFVNGDPGNDQRDQGGANHSFDRPLQGPNGATDNLGYLGGDFKGLLNHAGYIRDLGFSAVWITPIVDNPDEAFTGGDPVSWGSTLTDRGKTGYHGYWGVNFYQLDEHLPSPGLDFAAFTRDMRAQGLKVVLDIVANHGSPSFTMTSDQPQFGELYGADGRLLADHQNLPPEKLDPSGNPLHRFFYATPDLAQLSNLNQEIPEVQEYLIGSTLQWLDQGAAALRIDTIRHVPHAFWKRFSERLRAKHPGLFMFGESFDFEAANIATYTQEDGGAMSVLDFPLQKQLAAVFQRPGTDFGALEAPLFLADSPYRNPYELMTFYDNHDMARFDGSDQAFIDVHNWLFTARGIPVVYYGSETGFMRGAREHAGNRNYYGEERIQAGLQHEVHSKLRRIAKLRAQSPALQRGLQLNVSLRGDEAVFYRVYQHDGTAQTALVVLNKGDQTRTSVVTKFLEPGTWRDAFTGETVEATRQLSVDVPAHDVRVLLRDGPVKGSATRERLRQLRAVVPQAQAVKQQ